MYNYVIIWVRPPWVKRGSKYHVCKEWPEVGQYMNSWWGFPWRVCLTASYQPGKTSTNMTVCLYACYRHTSVVHCGYRYCKYLCTISMRCVDRCNRSKVHWNEREIRELLCNGWKENVSFTEKTLQAISRTGPNRYVCYHLRHFQCWIQIL